MSEQEHAKTLKLPALRREYVGLSPYLHDGRMPS